MYRNISDFLKEWETEKDSTLKIFNNLTDKSLVYKAYEGGRSIARIAWHITSSISEMGRMAGLNIEIIDEKTDGPFSAAYIKTEYELISLQLLKAVSEWNNDRLEEEIELYGEKWTIGFTLLVLVRHQIHHRAQLTILMRQAGLKVPGIYGPSKEEWADYNMQPAE
jgi:uncharacterized damage-inducible protein DinB